jgi:hypothetical protein
MARSFALGTEVASHPFELLEGRRGYVLYHPIAAAIGKRLIEDRLHQPWYALLVVDAATVLPAWISHTPGLSVTLYHRDFGPLDPTGRLAAAAGPERSPVERALLPRFTRVVALPDRSQPFALAYAHQNGWHDLDPLLSGTLLVLCVVAVVTTLWFGRSFHARQLHVLGERDRLFVVANFDTLTGLPNRDLLNDRVEQALRRAKRQGSRLGLLFLDLDRFKGEALRLTVSIGTAQFPRDGAFPERLLHRADFGMFQDKHVGHAKVGGGAGCGDAALEHPDESRQTGP